VTASCFSTPLAGALSASLSGSLSAPLARRARPIREIAPVRGLTGLAAVGLLLLLAGLLAPEQPSAQADICQRHNGVAACRVW